MQRKILLAVHAIVMNASHLSPALAQPTSTTSYSYYEVTGNSLLELHKDMMRKGPTAEGTVGYGVTTISPGQRMSVAACKSRGQYDFDAHFEIRLPKVAPTARLSAVERKQFSSFVRFVKTHEETHRSIWMNYIERVSVDLEASKTSDCRTAHSKAMALWQQMIAGCRQLHVVFDRKQRGPLRSHPFVKYAKR